MPEMRAIAHVRFMKTELKGNKAAHVKAMEALVEQHPAILPCGVTGEVPAPESEAAVEVAFEALPTSAEIEEG